MTKDVLAGLKDVQQKIHTHTHTRRHVSAHAHTHRSLGMPQFINMQSINNHKRDVKAVYKARQANLWVYGYM